MTKKLGNMIGGFISTLIGMNLLHQEKKDELEELIKDYLKKNNLTKSQTGGKK